MKTRHQFGKLIVIRSIYYIAEKYITSQRSIFHRGRRSSDELKNIGMDRFHSNRDNALSLVRDLCLHGMQREFRYISSIILVLNWSSDHYKTTQYSVSISIWDHNLETDHATQFVKQKADLFITDESFHDFVHSVVCPLHDEVILLYYDMTTRGSTLNELLAAIAARHSPVLSGGELSIILPSG